MQQEHRSGAALAGLHTTSSLYQLELWNAAHMVHAVHDIQHRLGILDRGGHNHLLATLHRHKTSRVVSGMSGWRVWPCP